MLKLGVKNNNNKNNESFLKAKFQSGAGSNESWYFKMRQIVLVEYTKYFEAHGFTRLKDERSAQQETPSSIKQAHTKVQNNQHDGTQTLHFIKWIQQDGFLYLTLNLDEIYLHARVGYCARYRSTSRLGFINEIMRFLTQEFHVHSFIYDFHLSAINSNFLASSQTGMQISQTSQIISKFLDEFVEFFSRIPLYSQNKVFKLIYEKTDSSLIPHQFRLIFDFIIYSKKKLTTEKSSIVSFKTLYIFDNNIAIYSLVDAQKSSTGDCSKYLVVKLESFTKESSAPHSPANSINRRQIITTKPSQTNKFTNSSSSSSFLLNINNNDKPQELCIRITCFYLFINKNPLSGSFASSSLLTSLNNDLEFINKVIEESINMYRQEMFWDNLALSMNSMRNMLNESVNIGLCYSVNSQELEQILSISHLTNSLDLDPGLDTFLVQCFMIRDKIKNYLKFSFGNNFIYAESDSIEYCVLLINEDLIKGFRHVPKQEEDGKKQNVSVESDQNLKSFILLKFDKLADSAQLVQVNRVKMSKQESLSNNSQVVGPKRSTTTDALSSFLSNNNDASVLGSSFKNDLSGNLNKDLSSMFSSKTYRYLGFTVNLLMYVLWESLFFTS